MNVTPSHEDRDRIPVAPAQIAPVLLDRGATRDRVMGACRAAGSAGADLVCVGEALVTATFARNARMSARQGTTRART